MYPNVSAFLFSTIAENPLSVTETGFGALSPIYESNAIYLLNSIGCEQALPPAL